MSKIAGWFKKLIGRELPEYMKGISLGEDAGWCINFKKADFCLFLRELKTLFPKDSIMFLEGSTPKIARELTTMQINTDTKVARGTYGKTSVFHIPLIEENLNRLIALFDKHAIPEICDHFHVYKDNKVLLEGYDILDQEVYLANTVDEALIKTFCTKLNCTYSTHQR
ncbi:hypothetical protein ACFL1E_05585 [Candidatus Omnitrophota bacterium]